MQVVTKHNQQVLPKLAIAMLVLGLASQFAFAAQINDRSVTLSSSSAGATNANYTFNFSVPSNTPIQSFEARICADPSGACVAPTGLDTSGATLLSQPAGLGSASGWTIDTSVPGALRMQNAANATAPAATQAFTFGGITNPTASDTSFYIRMTTYSDLYATTIDDGEVSITTAKQIGLTGIVPPILTFCVGTDIPGECDTATGDMINFGTFSPSLTRSGISQMRASTNAGSGYVITLLGSTLASGTNTIPAVAGSASAVSTSQFGLNLRDNATPDVGIETTGAGDGGVAPGYNTVNQFRFNDGDTVASAPQETNANTYTVSYMVNIEPKQAAGTYTATMTYICTATF